MTQADIANVDELEQAFPNIDPGVTPFGTRVVVQFRTAMTKTKGGLLLTADTRDTEKWNTQVAKVISIGPVAFKNRTTLNEWPEKAWVEPGVFVRVSKHGGDKWEVKIPGRDAGEAAIFAVMNDLDLIGKVTGDPLAMKAFI